LVGLSCWYFPGNCGPFSLAITPWAADLANMDCMQPILSPTFVGSKVLKETSFSRQTLDYDKSSGLALNRVVPSATVETGDWWRCPGIFNFNLPVFVPTDFPLQSNDLIPFSCTMILVMTTSQAGAQCTAKHTSFISTK